MIDHKNILSALQSLLQAARNYQLHQFAGQHPKLYFSAVLFAALGGYAFVLLFPALVILALLQLAGVVEAESFTVPVLSQGLIWFALLIFSAAMSHHIFTVKFALPKGTALPPDKAPALFGALQENKGMLFWPRFHSVLLTENFELDIQKTPVNGFPLWSKNTLLIGLPLMQILPRQYFDHALLRKLMQFSKGRNRVSNWLAQLRHIWLLYPAAFSQRKRLGEQVIAGFFRLYAPLYHKLSLYTAQRDELAADTLALREINDMDLFRTLESLAVGDYFYRQIYLPMLNAFLREKSANAAKLRPFATMPGFFRKRVDEEHCKQWLDAFCKQAVNTHSITPTLAQRMRNIGHSRVRPPKWEHPCAAEYYFSRHYAGVQQFMDDLWRRKLSRQLRRSARQIPRPGPALRIDAAAGQ